VKKNGPSVSHNLGAVTVEKQGAARCLLQLDVTRIIDSNVTRGVFSADLDSSQ
jgi:hypothetical protein